MFFFVVVPFVRWSNSIASKELKCIANDLIYWLLWQRHDAQPVGMESIWVPNAHYDRSKAKTWLTSIYFIDDGVDGVMPLPLPHYSFSLILTFSNEKQQPIATFTVKSEQTHSDKTHRPRISCTIDLNNLHVCIDGSRNECIFLSIQTWCDQQLHIWRVIRVRTRFFGLLNDCFMVVALNRHKKNIRMPFSVFIVQRRTVSPGCFFRISFLLLSCRFAFSIGRHLHPM